MEIIWTSSILLAFKYNIYIMCMKKNLFYSMIYWVFFSWWFHLLVPLVSELYFLLNHFNRIINWMTKMWGWLDRGVFLVMIFLWIISWNFMKIQVRKHKHLFHVLLLFGIMWDIREKNLNKHLIEVGSKIIFIFEDEKFLFRIFGKEYSKNV